MVVATLTIILIVFPIQLLNKYLEEILVCDLLFLSVFQAKFYEYEINFSS